MSRQVHPIRIAIIAAGLTEAQRRTLCALPTGETFVPINLPQDFSTIRALRFVGAVEVVGPVQQRVQARLPHRVTAHGERLREASEGML